jgi:uncharacterized membrane protein YqaE (UPF0057 family)
MSGKQSAKPRFGGVFFCLRFLPVYLLPAARLFGRALNPDERSAVHELYGNVAIDHQELSMDIIRIIIAILLPPLGVFLQVGFGGAFWLNILLTLLGYIPGIVHAVYIIAKR